MGQFLTFLQLSEEFGGTKFGPFTGMEIRLGSDPENNEIVLPEALGVSPQHVKVLKQGDNNFIVAPTDRTSAVYVYKLDGRPPKQITTPVACTTGDAFSLVTPEGARFFIVDEEQRVKAEKASDKSGIGAAKKGLTKKSMLAEIKRQGFSRFMTTGIGHAYGNAKRFIISGSFLRPRNIIMMLSVGSGWLFAGGIGCTALKLSGDKADAMEDLEECQGDLAAAGVGDSSEEPTIPVLTQQILGDREWRETLQEDSLLRKSYISKLGTIFQRRDKYKWVYKRKSSDFSAFKAQLEQKGMSEYLARVMAYTAAPPGFVPDREFSLIKQNTTGVETCGRGPAMLTYRQAKNLELEEFQLDALVKASVADSEDVELKRQALLATAGEDASNFEFEDDQVISVQIAMQGGFYALTLEGDDDRTNVPQLAKALGKALGDRATGVPEPDRSHWITARLMKFYAADMEYGFDQLDFANQIPTVALADASDNQKNFAIDNTAEVMARAVAIPCLARLDKDMQTPPEHLGSLPTLIQCGILNLLVDRESF